MGGFFFYIDPFDINTSKYSFYPHSAIIEP